MEIPKRKEYMVLSSKEREKLLREIADRLKLKWNGMVSYSRYGQSLKTAKFQFPNDTATFLFIPGDQIILGWDGFLDSSQDTSFLEFKQALVEDFNEYCGEEWETAEDFVRSITSPIRQAKIPPMLVEQKPRPFEDGVPVELSDLELNEWAKKSLEDFKNNPRSKELVLDSLKRGQTKLRFIKKQGEIKTEIIYPTSVDELQKRLEKEEFTLPDLDQWEYLCGGGCRFLFPWGDSLEFCYGKSWKQQPNFFGLTISFHPYHQEVIKNNGCWCKGGDGGSMECFGSLKVLNDLVGSPYFMGWLSKEDWEEERSYGLSKDYHSYRRIVVLN